MTHKMQVLSALLCLSIIAATETQADKSESETSDSLKLSKRDVDKFDVLRDLGNDIGNHQEPFSDSGNIDIDDLDGYSLFANPDFESSEELDEEKRGPMGLFSQLGKRVPMAFAGQLEKQVPMSFESQLEKRIPMGFVSQLGKRAPMGYYSQLGKRAPMGLYSQLGKRAPMGLYSQLGKRAPMGLYSQLGKRAPMGLYSQLGKRSAYSDETADDTEFSSRERRSPLPWMYSNSQRARYMRAKMIKRPNYRFFPQLG